jgi:hypothetical protein
MWGLRLKGVTPDRAGVIVGGADWRRLQPQLLPRLYFGVADALTDMTMGIMFIMATGIMSIVNCSCRCRNRQCG